MDDRIPRLRHLQGSSLAYTVYHGLLSRQDGRWIVPSFQRPLVWTPEQKERFIESVWLGLPIGEYTLHISSDLSTAEVLDGQQRWNAIFEYADDKFPVFGLRYSELTEVELRRFKHVVFHCREVRGLTHEQKLDAYNRLAYGGTPHERGLTSPTGDR